MIVVERLAKSFGTVQALHDVSFTAHDGRITGLLGANGAGKSTTLRIVSTVLHADRGHALVDGHDCARETLVVRRSLGVLPHASGIYPHLTARENIHYYGELHGLDKATIDARIETWSQRLDMNEFLERRTQGFSHGQKLKVALARSLVHAPRNVILDEPTSGLDVASTRALRDVIRGLKEDGCCVLFSSHIMQEVGALCDDIVIIARGRVVASGSPDQILAATGASNLEDAFMRASGDQSPDEAVA
ncbi:MAG TPA: ATP-binding cassette domain-containing protein [Steroidobacteraceae bacterium]|nr:ATP-binding cassette domain-containing protein [Steroidobacteraceae bacterium]